MTTDHIVPRSTPSHPLHFHLIPLKTPHPEGVWVICLQRLAAKAQVGQCVQAFGMNMGTHVCVYMHVQARGQPWATGELWGMFLQELFTFCFSHTVVFVCGCSYTCVYMSVQPGG